MFTHTNKVVPSTATPAEVLAVQQKLEANGITLPSLQWVQDHDINGKVFQTLTSSALIVELGVASLGA